MIGREFKLYVVCRYILFIRFNNEILDLWIAGRIESRVPWHGHLLRVSGGKFNDVLLQSNPELLSLLQRWALCLFFIHFASSLREGLDWWLGKNIESFSGLFFADLLCLVKWAFFLVINFAHDLRFAEFYLSNLFLAGLPMAEHRLLQIYCWAFGPARP